METLALSRVMLQFQINNISIMMLPSIVASLWLILPSHNLLLLSYSLVFFHNGGLLCILNSHASWCDNSALRCDPKINLVICLDLVLDQDYDWAMEVV